MRIAKTMPTRGLSDVIAEMAEDGVGSADTGLIAKIKWLILNINLGPRTSCYISL